MWAGVDLTQDYCVMKPRNVLLAAIAASCLVASLAWTQAKDPDHLPYTRYGWRFYLHGKSLSSDLVRSDILSSPSWSPSEPLPLSPGKAVEVARTQLHTLVENESDWFPSEIILKCVGRTPPQDAYRAWYYGIRFDPTSRPTPTNGPVRLESVVICVDLFGRLGTISTSK